MSLVLCRGETKLLCLVNGLGMFFAFRKVGYQASHGVKNFQKATGHRLQQKAQENSLSTPWKSNVFSHRILEQ